VSRLLFVVSRNAPERFEFLRYAFAGDDHVEVVLDRRRGDRRRDRAGVPAERRQRERRTHHVVGDLDRAGFAVVRRR
jgi:hypothetical protein